MDIREKTCFDGIHEEPLSIAAGGREGFFFMTQPACRILCPAGGHGPAAGRRRQV